MIINCLLKYAVADLDDFTTEHLHFIIFWIRVIQIQIAFFTHWKVYESDFTRDKSTMWGADGLIYQVKGFDVLLSSPSVEFFQWKDNNPLFLI